jgi:hypothetical protein
MANAEPTQKALKPGCLNAANEWGVAVAAEGSGLDKVGHLPGYERSFAIVPDKKNPAPARAPDPYLRRRVTCVETGFAVLPATAATATATATTAAT